MSNPYSGLSKKQWRARSYTRAVAAEWMLIHNPINLGAFLDTFTEEDLMALEAYFDCT